MAVAISFDTFPVQRRTRNQSFDFRGPDVDSINRRQSIKYHFPISGLEDFVNIDENSINEEDIRRRVFGTPLSQMSFVAVESSVWRPTVASCRRAVLWSKQRRLYEEQSRQRMEEFKNRPYMNHEYPELMKHYPGTWKLLTKEEINNSVKRLTTIPAPTSPIMMSRRRVKSAPATTSCFRKPMVRRPTTSNTI